MYPKDAPDIFSWQYNWNSLGNSYNALNKVWPAFSGGKKRSVKSGSNIKYNKTHGDWYLSCEDYWTLKSHTIKIDRSSLINYIHYASYFTGTKIEEKYFWWFLVNFDNWSLEASAVVQCHSRKYMEIKKKLIQYLVLCAPKYALVKCRVSLIFMEKKLFKFASGLELNDFKSLPWCILLESDSGFPWSSRVTNGLECYLLFRIPNLESGFAASLE